MPQTTFYHVVTKRLSQLILVLPPICLHLSSFWLHCRSVFTICHFEKLKSIFNVHPSTMSQFNSSLTCQCLPVWLSIDPHVFDQWPSQCRWPVPDTAQLHLRPLHQAGVSANQNAERWPHDADTTWPQRYRPHCDKTGETQKTHTLLFFSFFAFLRVWEIEVKN